MLMITNNIKTDTVTLSDRTQEQLYFLHILQAAIKTTIYRC